MQNQRSYGNPRADVDLDNRLLTVTGGQQAAQGAVLFRTTQGVVPPHAGVLSTALHAATRHLAAAIRRWLIVDRIARHFFASRSPNASWFFLKRLSRLCHVFARAEIRDKGMANSRVGQCGAQGFEIASRNGEDRSPAAAERPG
jgi:hypothetical protein